ncbi:YbgC/FadM family acyl-CoA thioesterase [Candidatus Woesearchaeota archaeon]|nr:YbgC/FadM family acyl-CoA thioesterase [Candidatus Woesearchaeota archaeon]
MEIKVNLNKLEFRVRYSHTDHFGVIYYGRYLDWLEAGRTEILRENGISYADYEKRGLFAPVVKLEIEYKKPAKYDEIIVLETRIERIGNSSVEFSYKLYRKGDNALVAGGKTVNVFIKKNGEKARVPDDVRNILED